MRDFPLYLEVLPLKHLWLFGGGGSSGGGGGTTTTDTTGKPLTWSQYVPAVTSAAYSGIMPKLASKYDVGMTPQERSFYTGQSMKDILAQTGSASKDLGDSLARSGTRGPAATEAYSDLARSKVMGGATAASGLAGADLTAKGQNTDRLLKAIGLPGAPVITGSTSTQTFSPARQSAGS
jgi:hypothetical protein